MYHNYIDAENCIRCFYYLGYEAKYAKVLTDRDPAGRYADQWSSNLTMSD